MEKVTAPVRIEYTEATEEDTRKKIGVHVAEATGQPVPVHQVTPPTELHPAPEAEMESYGLGVVRSERIYENAEPKATQDNPLAEGVQNTINGHLGRVRTAGSGGFLKEKLAAVARRIKGGNVTLK